MATTTLLRVETAGPVARVTLARPELRNAFDDALIVELAGTFRALDTEPSVRVVVLAADGPAFCAGADLNWMRRMAGYSREENLADAAALAEMLRSVATCRKPTIARVQGDAYAGGMGLLAACDIAVAAEGARFCLSEVKLGLVPATIAPYVVRAMGRHAAQRYVLTAERFDAATALRIGLVHETARPERLDAVVQGFVDHFLAASPEALAACKRLLDDVGQAPIDEALIGRTAESIADARASDDGRHGVQAFLGKTKPRWTA
ncbi:MAG TPA: enoyl-CoA hydratase/isomerase family protein [Methylibium sp.]|uniref:enoyl-CoA hydratase/isomerase family protein n=1 Tax=Methylibium sp. TaxID=2067992 RepID=UPI002DB5ACBB|nr:enoyl-CoA hydratase/isomerase family protein [Methylibium sp.]HEU4460804.1 enoyl-CoA hydratase/isomerase family protein [Methylibium sp.]